MPIPWVQPWRSFLTSGRNLRNGWLIAAGVLALYIGAIRPLQLKRSFATQRGTGLASVAGFEPMSLWQETLLLPQLSAALGDGIIGGVPQSRKAQFVRAALLSPVNQGPRAAREDEDRKMVRTCAMDLVVQKPSDANEKIRSLAESLGGFLVSSEVNGGEYARDTLTIRVPTSRFEEARAAIRKLSLRVESEKIDAQDVTRQYIDRDANLRNLRAEETQYLIILKQAHTVKDTLDVSEKLSAVREQIEQQQAEFDTLSKQIETVAISLTLRAEADAQVFGLRWRPLYQIKLALREGLEGVGSYAASMVSLVFYLPAVLLWLLTILAGAAVGWRVVRWTVRVFFGWPERPMVQNS
jgi:Domain of unknown function (DUF4349)